ncbi:MAG: hypothetical protein LBO72_00680 [Helicobacteraceae bacterium]|nr:hypothetical protein [Helicobacteraceae bacterium]
MFARIILIVVAVFNMRVFAIETNPNDYGKRLEYFNKAIGYFAKKQDSGNKGS